MKGMDIRCAILKSMESMLKSVVGLHETLSGLDSANGAEPSFSAPVGREHSSKQPPVIVALVMYSSKFLINVACAAREKRWKKSDGKKMTFDSC